MKTNKVPRERNPFLLSGKRRWRLFRWIWGRTSKNQLIIRARQQTDYLELTVEDNGVGADVEKRLSRQGSTGLGLRNVEERLQTVYRGGARFSFESQPRIGSRAQILIPIPGAA